MTEMTAKKIADVMNNEEARERLEKTANFDDAVAIFNEYGVEITVDELKKFAAIGDSDGELSAESLDQVAGGAGWWKRMWSHIWDALNGLLDGFNESYD